jgi:outer membrane protein assembly factor BamB
MPAVSRRLLPALLMCAALVAGGCSSDDDGTATAAGETTSFHTRALLPTAPSTLVPPPTTPTTASTGPTPAATTTTAAPAADPTGVTISAGPNVSCASQSGQRATFPASLVILDVASGAVKWSACQRRPGDAVQPVDLGPTVGAVFVPGDQVRTFHAFTREGQPAWTAPLPNTTLVPDHASTVYVGSTQAGEVRTRALDAATGQERWTVPGEDARAASPDAVVLVAAGPPAQIVVRDPASGAGRWAQGLVGAPTAVAISGDAVVAVFPAAPAEGAAPVPSVAVYDINTGQARWVRNLTDAGAAAVVDGAILVWGTDDTTAALDVGTGAQRWRRPGRPLGGVGGFGVSADGLLFLGSATAEPSVRVVELATGVSRWTTGSTDLRAQALGAGSGLLLFFTSLKGVEAVDMATGDGRWSFDWQPSPGTTTTGVVVSADVALVSVGKAPA